MKVCVHAQEFAKLMEAMPNPKGASGPLELTSEQRQAYEARAAWIVCPLFKQKCILNTGEPCHNPNIKDK